MRAVSEGKSSELLHLASASAELEQPVIPVIDNLYFLLIDNLTIFAALRRRQLDLSTLRLPA